MTEELNETRRKQQALLEHRMYHLDPVPPKLPPQEYIELFFAENEDKYLSWYGSLNMELFLDWEKGNINISWPESFLTIPCVTRTRHTV